MDPLDVYTAKLEGFVAHLFAIGAIKTGSIDGYPLASGKRSPYYLNLRLRGHKDGVLEQHDVEQMAEFMYGIVAAHDLEYDGIAGVPDGGNPFAQAIKQYAWESPEKKETYYLSLGKIGKGHEIDFKTKPNLEHGRTALLVDDLITDAGRKLLAAQLLQAYHYRVEHCVVFADREEGGRERLAQEDITLYSVITARKIFDICRRRELITPAAHEEICQYHRRGYAR